MGSCGQFFRYFFSLLFLPWFLKGFFWDFGRVLEAKMGAKTSFWSVFGDVFLNGILKSIFWCFFDFFQCSNLDFCAHRRCFVRIFRESMFLKTMAKKLDLGLVFRGQIDGKSIKNRFQNQCVLGRGF